jgi:hypothetical protein
MMQMFVRKPGLSWRGRLPLVATFLLLMGAIIAAPGVSNARAAQKFFTATINPSTVSGSITAQSFTVTITNCSSGVANCGIPSSIALGSAKILVPTRFSNVSFVSATSPTEGPWTGSGTGWDGTYIKAASSGSNKLAPGEVLNVTFTADVSGCSNTGSPYQFTTSAYGSTTWDQPPGNSEPFSIVTPPGQPQVAIDGCVLHDGESATDPDTGETVTVNGLQEGESVTVSFPKVNLLDCSAVPNFGTQWSSYHLPSQVNISTVPSAATFTFTFPTPTGTDSSWYLICWQSASSWTDRNDSFVAAGGHSILANCYPADAAPCVTDQHRTLPPYSDSNPDLISISVKVPEGDPNGR